MSSPQTAAVMNRVLTILSRSFPAYMQYACPYAAQEDDRALVTLKQIAADQQHLAERTVEFILAAGDMPEVGQFPMDFTGLHDAGVDFLTSLAIRYQEYDIRQLEQCVDALRLAPAARILAEEALGLARGHLELLEEARPAHA